MKELLRPKRCFSAASNNVENACRPEFTTQCIEFPVHLATYALCGAGIDSRLRRGHEVPHRQLVPTRIENGDFGCVKLAGRYPLVPFEIRINRRSSGKRHGKYENRNKCIFQLHAEIIAESFQISKLEIFIFLKQQIKSHYFFMD